MASRATSSTIFEVPAGFPAPLARAAEALADRGFGVVCCPTGEAARSYLAGAIQGTTVGLGGSVTLDTLGVYDLLGERNQVFWHWRGDPLAAAAGAEVYLASANALAETGEVVLIDGNGNRAASCLWGHRRVYLVVGRNKLSPDLSAAIHRARNVAAPRNARRLRVDTPCALTADRCYDCHSPSRICRGVVTLLQPPALREAFVLLLVNQDLGY